MGLGCRAWGGVSPPHTPRPTPNTRLRLARQPRPAAHHRPPHQSPDDDVERLSQTLQLLQEFAGGNDEVELVIVASRTERVEMELPTLRPRYTPNLHQRLEELLGAQALRVEALAG